MTLKLRHEGWVKINQGENWGKGVLEIDLAISNHWPLGTQTIYQSQNEMNLLVDFNSNCLVDPYVSDTVTG